MSAVVPYSVIDDYTLSVIKAPPAAEILTARAQDDNVLNNNLVGHLFQFSYRYIYSDGEKSVWSVPTHVVIPFLYGNNIYEMVLEEGITEHIIIRLRLFIIPTDVDKIEIAFRVDGGAWYYYDELKVTSSGDLLGYMDYDFLNDLIPIQLADGDITRACDYVPRLAEAQEIINRNIISYGNILENYTNPKNIDVELTANTAYTEVFHKDLFSGVYSPYNNTNIVFNAHVIDRAFNIVEINFGNALDGELANYVIYLISGGTYHIVTYNRVENWDNTSTSELANAIERDEWVVSAVPAANIITVTFDIELDDPGIIGLAYRNYGFPLTLKDYVKYYIGIEYLDRFGRVGTVIRDDTMVVDIPSLGSQALAYNDYISYITYQINHIPPKWAYSWRFCYATNIIWWMQYLIRPYHDIDRSVFRDREKGIIKIKINQGVNDVRDVLDNYRLDNYVWEEGDRIRFIGTVPIREMDVTHFPVEVIDTSTGLWGTARELDYEILGFDGVYIFVTDFTQDDALWEFYSDIPDIDSPDADDILVEIYRIRKDTENLIYKSIPLNTEKTEGIIVEDYDGNVYNTIIIGDQEWMVENFRADHFDDGVAITYCANAGEWAAAAAANDPAYCYCNFNVANKAAYGAIYNWWAVDAVNGLAPDGWRIPEKDDFIKLVNSVGGNAVAGGKLKEIGTVHWLSPNTGATNQYGFTSMPNGYVKATGVWDYFTEIGFLWSSTFFNATSSWMLRSGEWNLQRTVTENTLEFDRGCAVRCVRDFDSMGAYGIDNPGTSSRAHADTEGVVQLWNSRLCMLPVANVAQDRSKEVTLAEPTTTSTTSSTSTTSTGVYDVPFAPGLKCCVVNIPYFGHKYNIVFDQLWDSKINIADPNFKEQRVNKIRWGGAYIDDSQINNLCRFLYRDEKRMPDKYGDIYGMREIGYTLKVLQQSKNTSIYIGREMALDASGNTQMIYTDSTLGTISPAIEEFGTVFNDSIVVSDRWMYFFDIYSGRVIRDAPNGMVDIGFGEHKMQTYFRQKADALLESGVGNVNVIGGVDRENNMVYFTFIDSVTPANNETIGFHESGRWKSFFSFVPECYGKLGENTFFSFKNGKPYIHNSSVPDRCTFYTTKYNQELWLVSSINSGVNKQFNSITIVSNKMWTLPDNDSILISPTATYPNGMASKLRTEDFEEYEGEFRAAFLGDLLTASETPDDYYLYNGRELRGRELLMKLQNQENGTVNLFIVKVNSMISR